MIAMQPLRYVPSPNVSARPPGARVRLIVVHDTEGSYAGAVSWFAQQRSQVSAHLVMREDGAEVTQMVPLDQKAWHACNFNSASVGIEGAGVSARGFSTEWWLGMAKIVAWLLHSYGLPCRWAGGGEGEGFASHHDLGQAGGGHSDPVAVDSPAWVAFVGMVTDAYGALSGAPLPAWALRGAPPVARVTLPPPAPENDVSHAGAAGVEAGDTHHAHATMSGSPSFSWPDVQYRLRLVGANPQLGITGHDDEATRLAVGTLQRAYGLPVTRDLNPETVAVLEKATGGRS